MHVLLKLTLFSQVGVSASIWKDGPFHLFGKMEFVACDIASVHDILEYPLALLYNVTGMEILPHFQSGIKAGCMGPN